jgi:putative membrane protein
MRWVNIGVIVALVAVILIFALQNLESVTMSFLGFRISAPLAVVAVVLYLLGMATVGPGRGERKHWHPDPNRELSRCLG